MIFRWLQNRRRRKLLAAPFPPQWQQYLEKNLPYFRYLDPEERTRLRDALRIFVAEKNWEGCNGLEVTDEMRVTIAAHACLMALGLERDPFASLMSILIYPTSYAAPREDWHAGWSLINEIGLEGQSNYRGPVILSWADVRRDTHHPGHGHNLVWHEFAHQIDMLDRSTNGTPPLETAEQRRRWHQVMVTEFNRLVDDAAHGRATLLDEYGAENEAEFFAVASECFFDCPIELREEHPGLYELLRDYYRQDTAGRMLSHR